MEDGDPEEAGPDAAFAAGLAAGVFRIQSCGACGRYTFPPRLLCPSCGDRAMRWSEASGEGVLHAFTIVRRRSEMGGDYNVALVDLAEGPRMMSRIDGCSDQDLRSGMPLRARIFDTPAGPAVVFVPAPEDSA